MYEDTMVIHEELSGARNQQKPLRLLFPASENDDRLAQDRQRELTLVSLKMPGNKILNMFLKINFSSLAVKETASQNI